MGRTIQSLALSATQVRPMLPVFCGISGWKSTMLKLILNLQAFQSDQSDASVRKPAYNTMAFDLKSTALAAIAACATGESHDAARLS